jgi:uncharacterized membrane protein YphA (DoxX/SURF4 family)
MESKKTRSFWAGRILSAIVMLFMLFDGVTKLIQIAPVTDAFRQLGYPVTLAPVIGTIELIATFLYALPRTSTIGAILLTAIFGGAIASHMRLEDPLFSHTLFGVYLGLMSWGGLYLRDARLRTLVPLYG